MMLNWKSFRLTSIPESDNRIMIETFTFNTVHRGISDRCWQSRNLREKPARDVAAATSSSLIMALLIYKPTLLSVFHGFSAVLTTSQAGYVLQHPSILATFEDRRRNLHTTRSPQFLGLRNQRGLWSESDYGSDVIIGLFDTGIWPEPRSFSDLNLGPVPSRWKGVCQIGDKFSSRSCNRKIVGARFFSKGHDAAGMIGDGGINDTVEFQPPRDAGGHGTHTASTAAGRYTFKASMAGYAEGEAVENV